MEIVFSKKVESGSLGGVSSSRMGLVTGQSRARTGCLSCGNRELGPMGPKSIVKGHR